jgi:hypothetical protein
MPLTESIPAKVGTRKNVTNGYCRQQYQLEARHEPQRQFDEVSVDF